MSGRGAHSRRRSREVALQVLYAMDLAHVGDVDAVFDTAASRFELPEGARAFAKELVTGVAAHRQSLDAALGAVSRRWRVERMGAVDRNVLRLAAFEILVGGTPAEVAIDEAVELARRFGGDRSPGFVNGVLDALARDARPPATGAPS
jgi:N utilization substance protein B